ncbi:helix-turn-helix domain-containing protein [Rheinheimera sp.]|uniref:helix-turn-helix domain-containing protein n=1 Tax=Rheinheimera sp. TaxID=1869214 RepID=UPI00273362B0|nr:helix-turn-helix domain-containing protein [Rheinheimera sp.]MDP2713692.1 helix-turn-helix domain-containing protein [Rheinheimera sp.]
MLSCVKKALKQHGISYVQVAVHLQLTEASVKRLFSQKQFTMQRLEQVCQLMQLELADLLQLMSEQQQQLQQLSYEQEEEITRDLTLLLVAVSVLNRWSMQDILDWYQLSEHECIRKLVQLDRLKLIELLPNNKIRLRVSANFSWREGGPIQRFFQQKIAQEFFQARFNSKAECLLVLNGMLSAAGNDEFQRKLRRLASEFNELNRQEASLPLAQRNGVSIVLAMRDWRFGLFKPLLKKS